MDFDKTESIAYSQKDLDYFAEQLRKTGRYDVSAKLSTPSDRAMSLPSVKQDFSPTPIKSSPMTPFTSQPAQKLHFTEGACKDLIDLSETYVVQQPRPAMGSSLFDAPAVPQAAHGKIPQLPRFSGQGKDDEVSFQVWKNDVRCLLRDGFFAPAAIMQGIRQSLKGKARTVLVHMGDVSTPQEVLAELDCVYGIVSSTEKIREMFYSAHQQPNESVADFSIRLEELVGQLPVTSTVRNQMLCSRLWSGLCDPSFRNFSRFKFESVDDFSQLRKVLRELEEDFKSSRTSTYLTSSYPSTLSTSPPSTLLNSSHSSALSTISQSSSAQKGHSSHSSSAPAAEARQCVGVDTDIVKQLKELSGQMSSMNQRMEKMEGELQDLKKSRQSSWQRSKAYSQQSNESNSKKKPLNGKPPLSKGQ